MSNIVLILVIVAMLIGAAGTVLPILPGIPFIFAAALFYGWYEGFTVINSGYLIVLGIITAISILFSYLSTVLGTRHFGASKWGSVGAISGLFFGLIMFPPIGIIIGPLLGAFIGEYLTQKDSDQAIRASVGALIGLFSGIVVNLLIAVGMVISFIIKVI